MISKYVFSEKLIKKDLLEIEELSQKIKRLKFNKKDFKKKINLLISSDYTTNYFTNILKLFLINKKVYPKIHETEYGSLKFLTKDLNNDFWKNKSDFFLLIPSSRNFSFFPKIGDSKNLIIKKANLEANNWLKVWSRIDKNIIQTTFDPPFIPTLGNEDAVSFGGKLHFVRLVNSILVEKKPAHVNLIDIENIVFKNLNTSWQDNRLYFLTKQPYNMETILPLASSFCGKILGKLGLSKKVIVLDLDNTLWGGIVGDEGISGINLDVNNPDGEAFLEFQKYIKTLSENGLILCISSKNNESIVREVFKKHNQMILKLKDFTIIKANYEDKAKNIKEISKILNLGLDSFVFIDDSKLECELVKKKLPEVFVINLDVSEPANYVKEVEIHNLFYFNNLTSADLNRAKSYKKLEKFNKIKFNSSNVDNFLKSLKPVIYLQKLSQSNITRVSQLLAKTNQFKFNKNIFSEKELEKLKKNVIVVSFKDNIQNYGIIGVLIIENKNNNLSIEIRNWVLSCRVFSRRIENYILNILIKKIKKLNYKSLSFAFEFTEKNNYLQLFLKKSNIMLNKNKKKYLVKITSIKNIKNNYIKLEKAKNSFNF